MYFAVGDKVISNDLKSPIYRPQGHHSIYGGFQTVGEWRSLYLQRQNTQQSLYNIVLQLLTVRIRKHTQLSFASWCMGRYTTQLRFVVYLMHTQLSFASWCIISKIHNSASPHVVYFCVSNSRQLKNIIIIIQTIFRETGPIFRCFRGFKTNITPLRRFYSSKGILCSIDAMQKPDQVFKDITKQFEKCASM